MTSGQFDTDTSALKKRIQCNENGTNDLNEWIFEHLDLKSGQRVLELGCGTGKQTVPLMQKILPKGTVVAVDVSRAAIDELKPKLLCGMTPICSDFDDVDWLSPRMKEFDRILAAYSIYYSKDAVALINSVYKAMNHDAVFFCCGPSFLNNAELKTVCQTINTDNTDSFMETKLAKILFDTFRAKNVEVFRFSNTITFNTSDDVITFWKSHNLYEKNLEQLFRLSIENLTRRNGKFRNTKRVIGYRCVKR